MSTEADPPHRPSGGESREAQHSSSGQLLIQRLINTAEQALAHGDLGAVEISVGEILEIDPDNVRALELRDTSVRIDDLLSDADQMFAQGNWQAVEGLVDELLQIDPDNSRARDWVELRKHLQELVRKAEQAFTDRNWQAARQYVDDIFEIDPENIQAKAFRTALDRTRQQIERLSNDAQQAVSHLN